MEISPSLVRPSMTPKINITYKYTDISNIVILAPTYLILSMLDEITNEKRISDRTIGILQTPGLFYLLVKSQLF